MALLVAAQLAQPIALISYRSVTGVRGLENHSLKIRRYFKVIGSKSNQETHAGFVISWCTGIYLIVRPLYVIERVDGSRAGR